MLQINKYEYCQTQKNRKKKFNVHYVHALKFKSHNNISNERNDSINNNNDTK